MSRFLLTQAPRHLPPWLILGVRRYQTSCQSLRTSREKTLRPVFTPKNVHVLHRRSSLFRSKSTIDGNERRNLPQYRFSARHSREPKHGGLDDDRGYCFWTVHDDPVCLELSLRDSPSVDIATLSNLRNQFLTKVILPVRNICLGLVSL